MMLADQSKVFVTSGEGFLSGKDAVEVVKQLRLYKTLSLILANQASIPILPTLLVVEDRKQAVAEWVREIGPPVMVRMDYSSLPREKPLGGVPVDSLEAIWDINVFLMNQGVRMLLQTNAARFSNIYSAGVLFLRDSEEVKCDIVGCGFDASDLRLGFSIPHETCEFDLRRVCARSRILISDSDYAEERRRRCTKIDELLQYFQYVNAEHRLLSRLPESDPSSEDGLGTALVPMTYTPMPERDVLSLIDYSASIRDAVLPRLPESNAYVASFSLMPLHGWVLWDVYGAWYSR